MVKNGADKSLGRFDTGEGGMCFDSITVGRIYCIDYFVTAAWLLRRGDWKWYSWSLDQNSSNWLKLDLIDEWCMTNSTICVKSPVVACQIVA